MKIKLSRPNNAVLGTLAEQVISVSEKPDYTVVKNHPLLQRIKAEYAQFFPVFGKETYSGKGRSVAQADQRVDAAFNSLKHILNGYIRLKVEPQFAAAEALHALIRRFGVELYRRSYGEQTENIDKLLDELRKPIYGQYITDLSIEHIVDELNQAQESFKTIYLQQVEANTSLRTAPSASGLRKRLEKALRNYFDLVAAMREEAGWGTLYTELNELAKATNNTIQTSAAPDDNTSVPGNNTPG